MNLIENLTICLISRGADTQKKLGFELEVPNERIGKTVKVLLDKKLIEIKNDKFDVTSKGLLIASEIFLNKDIKIKYKTKNNKAFFEYKNPLKYDILFLPYLSFDTINNSIEDNSYRLYRTRIDLSNLDILVLQVIENLLYDIPFETKGGFWILKSKRNFCGFEISNLLSTAKKLKLSEFEIKIAFSEHIYVLILEGKVKNNKLEKLSLTCYLNNCGEMPYLDCLNYLNRKLKLFLRFVKLESIPLGNEVIIKNFLFKKFFKTHGNSFFIPKLYGKLIFKGKRTSGFDVNQPLIVAINPKNIDGVLLLKKVLPWFVCCNGGFLEEDFRKKQEFQFHHIESYDFPELTIIQIMLSPYFKFEEEFFSLKDSRDIKEVELII